MAQRLAYGSEGGKWEFPGGKIEPGESPRACLQRELQEELGITVSVDEVLDVISTVKDQQQIILLYFLCQIVQGEPVTLECQQVGWFDSAEIVQLEKPENDDHFWSSWRKK